MLQVNVAIQAISKRVKAALNWGAARRASELEIGNIHGAVRFHLGQRSLKIVVRTQHSVDALKNAKVRVLELVRAGNRCLARIVRIPWTEMSARLDFTGRQRVKKADVVAKSVFATDRMERHLMNLESQRLGGFACDFQNRDIGN